MSIWAIQVCIIAFSLGGISCQAVDSSSHSVGRSLRRQVVRTSGGGGGDISSSVTDSSASLSQIFENGKLGILLLLTLLPLVCVLCYRCCRAVATGHGARKRKARRCAELKHRVLYTNASGMKSRGGALGEMYRLSWTCDMCNAECFQMQAIFGRCDECGVDFCQNCMAYIGSEQLEMSARMLADPARRAREAPFTDEDRANLNLCWAFCNKIIETSATESEVVTMFMLTFQKAIEIDTKTAEDVTYVLVQKCEPALGFASAHFFAILNDMARLLLEKSLVLVAGVALTCIKLALDTRKDIDAGGFVEAHFCANWLTLLLHPDVAKGKHAKLMGMLHSIDAIEIDAGLDCSLANTWDEMVEMAVARKLKADLAETKNDLAASIAKLMIADQCKLGQAHACAIRLYDDALNALPVPFEGDPDATAEVAKSLNMTPANLLGYVVACNLNRNLLKDSDRQING